MRRNVPESPRWLFIHGRQDEAERIVDEIEREVEQETDQPLPEPDRSLKIHQRNTISFREIAHVAFSRYPKRALLGLALFIGQAFLYNAVTFNLGTLLSDFYGVASGIVPAFFIVWAVGNFAGPVVLGRLFDTVGRKPMITLSYLGSAAVAVGLAAVFVAEAGGLWMFMAVLVVCFFLASSGASAAYLTVSEIFPMETRALAIAFFYAVGTAVGGITGPLLFGQLIESGERGPVAVGFLIGAAVMAIGGIAELLWGVNAGRTATRRHRGAADYGRARHRRPARGASRMTRCQMLGHDPVFRTDGSTMLWECRRGCGFNGAKTYDSAAAATRYATAFEPSRQGRPG